MSNKEQLLKYKNKQYSPYNNKLKLILKRQLFKKYITKMNCQYLVDDFLSCKNTYSEFHENCKINFDLLKLCLYYSEKSSSSTIESLR